MYSVPAVMDADGRRLKEHVAALCSAVPDRSPGTDGNRVAVEYVASQLESLGIGVEMLPLEVVGWIPGRAVVDVDGLRFEAQAGPFSPHVCAQGPLVPVETAMELTLISEHDGIVLLHGEIASSQLTPRDYPWYSNTEHTAILDCLERIAPLAVVAATGKSPATTGALSPFPLIEDPSFSLPSAYVDEAAGRALAARAGQETTVVIESRRFSAVGKQPIARHIGTGSRRVLITAHVDSKPGTPGAIDNAAGVAILLGAAALLADTQPAATVEFVPFNGEDHATSPGEVAYLKAHPDTDDIALVINIDGAGSPGGPTLVSRYNIPPQLDSIIDLLLARHDMIASGEPWFASDHAIFAMRGVPALALTSHDFGRLCEEVTHTAADTADGVDASVLVAAAGFVADAVIALG